MAASPDAIAGAIEAVGSLFEKQFDLGRDILGIRSEAERLADKDRLLVSTPSFIDFFNSEKDYTMLIISVILIIGIIAIIALTPKKS